MGWKAVVRVWVIICYEYLFRRSLETWVLYLEIAFVSGLEMIY